MPERLSAAVGSRRGRAVVRPERQLREGLVAVGIPWPVVLLVLVLVLVWHGVGGCEVDDQSKI